MTTDAREAATAHPAGATLQLKTDTTELWLLRAPQTHDAPRPRVYNAELDCHEKERAAAYTRPRDRTQYLAAHVALRRLLAAYTGVPPQSLRYGRLACAECGSPHGRPTLLDPAPAPHFSLSHSQGMILIGVSTLRLGVDVQCTPTAECVDLCLHALHPAESHDIERHRAEHRPTAFARLWTRKEAYLKGLGTGITRSLAADNVSERGEGRQPQGWSIRNIPVPPGYAAAVALATETAHNLVVRALDARFLH